MNTNPQALRVANEKFRRIADKAAGLYGILKIAQAEATAEGWLALFPNDSDTIGDGSQTDGRTIMTNAEARALLTNMGSIITFFEASSNAVRDNCMKWSVNPDTQI